MKAALYIRVSKEEQAEKDLSLPAQKSRIIAYCQSQDWEVYDFYLDDGYSAKDLDRPEMKRLIKDAKEKKFNAVVVVRLDRISRKQKDVLYLIEDVFEPNGIGFKSVTQSFDTTTAFGKAAIGMLAVFAQLERDQLIERIVDTKLEAAEQGRFMGGPPPYGYKHNPVKKSVETDDVQASIVRIIYSEYLKGEIGYQGIADLLTEQKIPSPQGRRNGWNRSTVLKILKSPFYAGFLPHKDVLHKGRHPALVAVSDWEQVQKILATRNKFSPTIHSGLVSGFIFCGECGARMRTKNVWQNHPCEDPKRIIRYYICYSQDRSTPYMVKDVACRCGYKQADEIDKKVIDKLMDYSLKPGLIKRAVKEFIAANNSNSSEKSLAQLKKEHSQLKTRIDRWYDAFEKGALDPDQLTERIRELRDRRELIEEQIGEAETAAATAQERLSSVDGLMVLINNFRLVWPNLDDMERKGLIKNIVKGVRVFPDNRIELEFFVD